MIRILLAMLLAVPLCLFSAYPRMGAIGREVETPDKEKGSYQKITANEAKIRMDGEEHFILLDVRTDDEFREAHIEGAVLIPDYEIRDRAEIELPDKGALIFVYCRSGRRSAHATKELLELGYANVVDMGGIMDWTYGTVSEK